MTREQVKQKVSDYIKENNRVSYIELQRLLDELRYNYQGDLCIISSKCERAIFWDGWNQDAIDLMNEIQDEGDIHKEPTQFLTYLLDGGGLSLPIVQSAVDLKQDCWIPVVFCPGPEKARKRDNG